METIARMLAVSVFVLLSACTQPPARNSPVGLSFAVYEDSERRSWTGPENRPLRTVVWYPAAAGAKESEWRVSILRAGWSAQDAPFVASPKKFPLVVLSHGTGAAAAQVSWLAETLASNGYVVAAVNHHGNTIAEDEYVPHGFMLWWERARDVSVLIDNLLSDPRFGPRIDSSRIGLGGHSLGGYTALAIAGARLDREQWQRFCAANSHNPACELPPEAPVSMAEVRRLLEQDEVIKASVKRASESYRDKRVRAVYAIAPALGPAMTRSSLNRITIPVRITVGTMDVNAPPETNAKAIAGSVPNAQLQLLPDVTHYMFVAPCNLWGRIVARWLCSDPQGLDRRELHRLVGADALEFFNRTLSPGT